MTFLWYAKYNPERLGSEGEYVKLHILQPKERFDL